MNWTVLILVGVAVIILIVWLLLRNKKDEQDLEKQLNEDYPKPRDEQKDAEPEDIPH